mmetsp:Transcript_24054/g.68178  ORF Transcript_24054/g.68178 Transcript_24054/m.68178 type:complete len:192 (+) Transcript_24054:177-752(+)
MAFFGLTHLGEQQYFRSNSNSHGLDLTLFSETDFINAAHQTWGEDTTLLDLDKLDLYFEKLYRGPLIGSSDKDLVLEALPVAADGSAVPLADLVNALLDAQQSQREIAAGREYNANEYRSNTTMREAGRRNERLKHNPRDKYVNPVTAAMEVGWSTGSRFAELDRQATKRFPKRFSQETAFADAMAAAGNL